MTEKTEKTIVPDGFKENAKGDFVALANVREIDLLKDEEVANLMAKAKEAQEALATFKKLAYSTVSAFVELSTERYDVTLGGQKGNVTLSSFDGRQKVQFAVNECATFDEGIMAAKAIIDECIHEWSEGANENLRAVTNNAFDTDKEGNINTHRILALRRLAIDDARWKRAMDAISDSLQVSDTKNFIRFYERPSSDKKWQSISLNIADL